MKENQTGNIILTLMRKMKPQAKKKKDLSTKDLRLKINIINLSFSFFLQDISNIYPYFNVKTLFVSFCLLIFIDNDFTDDDRFDEVTEC